MRQAERREALSEAEVAASGDAVAGRAMVEARVARRAPEDQAAFWEAVGRCFGGGTPPDHRGPEAAGAPARDVSPA